MGSVLVIDNYDSFTYNLVQYLGELSAKLDVVRNDRLTWQQIRNLAPAAIVISPGPGNPDQAGVSLDVLRNLGHELPILGVCLGHQAIGQAFGARVVRGAQPVHGKTSAIHHDGRGLFDGLPNPFRATRYHSLVVERDSLPAELEVTAWTEDGVVMGLRHRTHRIFGVQFHPESILTDGGMRMLANFLGAIAGQPVNEPALVRRTREAA
ncbi:MAG: aminodeoxychorismate/anthranilate synthase component II [Candidatus Wallbacteria bacterium]|nr:aminodeoxychorismate/anthranilate synthase component II [Candidatus Wallbacteria bacterium]